VGQRGSNVVEVDFAKRAWLEQLWRSREAAL